MNNFKNKYGYFSPDGKEYIITDPKTPRPWVNVICPSEYGIIVSQTGGGFSWKTHTKLNRLTRWQQDLIKDDNGKYIFIKDTESGDLWSATWQPVQKEYEEYKCAHGIGYSRFENKTEGISSQLTVFVPPEDSLEVWRLVIKNESDKERKLQVSSYLEWCLGASASVEHRELHNLFIETKTCKDRKITAGKRVWSILNENDQFFNRTWGFTAFHAGNPLPERYLDSREHFIGMYGSLCCPAMQGYSDFSEEEKVNKWDEPIASLQWDIQLKPGEEKVIEIVTGMEENAGNIDSVKDKYLGHSEQALEDTKQYWDNILGTTHVETPNDAFNLMMNTWLKYQAISARLLGRTGYYQNGGAFGFRDQLQDSQIYFKIQPEKAAQTILRHASRQYQDGSVQHWWHPITGSGHRNRISDNLLWLPFITYRYIMETADYGILNKTAPYMDGGEGTIREHCEKAIERVWNRRSERGLPKIGEGDWNDGLSAVGWKEKGESVWLGHFLAGILRKWSLLEEDLGNSERAQMFANRSEELINIINEHGWDGKWYRRAYTDEGKVLGSESCEEGKIFLNAQTWAVLHDVVREDRIKPMQDSLDNILYREYGPILFYPAYSICDPSIGYLTRYAPGTRENGGLYFHAACWAVAAECEMNRPEKVSRLLNSFLPPLRGTEPDKYIAEPYVIPGNVDGPDSPKFGRGGWTWYTGSAAWLYTIGFDWIIGLMPVKDGLKIQPCIPHEWEKVSGYRYFRNKRIEFEIENTGSVDLHVEVNGKKLKENLLKLDDFKEDTIKLKIQS